MLLVCTILAIEILFGMEMDLFVPAFPELQSTFHLSPALVQLTLSLNFIVLAVCGLFSGVLSDRFNRRHVILVSLSIFVVGSLLSSIAPNFSTLLLGRVLQGVGTAGAVVITYPIIADQFSLRKQASIFTAMNGIFSIFVAFAPVIGSYITFYFHWRGNFFALFFLGLICLATSFLFIPSHAGNPNTSLSLKTYAPLLHSSKLMKVLLALAFLIIPYWIFIGMFPILYMETLNIPLKTFGYLMSIEAIIYAIICLITPQLLNTIGERKFLRLGIVVCCISVLFTLVVMIMNTRNPFLLLSVLILYTTAEVIPYTLLFPLSMSVLPNTKGRANALGLTIRLVMISIILQVVSYFYTGSFFPMGLNVLIFMSLAIYLLIKIFLKVESTKKQ